MRDAPAIDEVSVQIAATPEVVWSMISDIRRMGEWSPECRRCLWVGRRRGVGAHFVGINRDRGWVWPAPNVVEEFLPGRAFAFRNTAGNVRWRFTIEPAHGGTRLVERRDTSIMRTNMIRMLYRPMGGYDARTRTLLGGMQQTVDRIKAAAER